MASIIKVVLTLYVFLTDHLSVIVVVCSSLSPATPSLIWILLHQTMQLVLQLLVPELHGLIVLPPLPALLLNGFPHLLKLLKFRKIQIITINNILRYLKKVNNRILQILRNKRKNSSQGLFLYIQRFLNILYLTLLLILNIVQLLLHYLVLLIHIVIFIDHIRKVVMNLVHIFLEKMILIVLSFF